MSLNVVMRRLAALGVVAMLLLVASCGDSPSRLTADEVKADLAKFTDVLLAELNADGAGVDRYTLISHEAQPDAKAVLKLHRRFGTQFQKPDSSLEESDITLHMTLASSGRWKLTSVDIENIQMHYGSEPNGAPPGDLIASHRKDAQEVIERVFDPAAGKHAARK